MKKIVSLLLALVLLCSCVLAQADLAGLESVLASCIGDAETYAFRASLKLDTLNPYGKTMLTQMNQLLQYMSADFTVGEQSTKFAFNVQDTPVLDLTETKNGSGTALTTGLLRNRVLVSQNSALEKLFGIDSDEVTYFDPFLAFSEAKQSYTALKEALPQYGQWKKANYKIKNVGTAKWECIAKLNADQAAELQPLLVEVLASGMDSAYKETLKGVTFKKGLVVVLYQDGENGNDMAVYIKGTLVLNGGKTRNLSYQWAFAPKDGGTVQSYKYELTGGGGKDGNRSVNATYTLCTEGEDLTLSGNWKGEFKVDGTTPVLSQKHALSGKISEDGCTLSGTVTDTSELDDTKTTTTCEPDLTITLRDTTAAVTGTMTLSKTQGKKDLLGLTLTFSEIPGETAAQEETAVQEETVEILLMDEDGDELDSGATVQTAVPVDADEYLVGQPPINYTAYTVPETGVTVSLDAADEEVLAALLDEMYQNAAGKLLIALSSLPTEDLALIADNLSEENFNLFLSLAQGL